MPIPKFKVQILDVETNHEDTKDTKTPWFLGLGIWDLGFEIWAF